MLLQQLHALLKRHSVRDRVEVIHVMVKDSSLRSLAGIVEIALLFLLTSRLYTPPTELRLLTSHDRIERCSICIDELWVVKSEFSSVDMCGYPPACV